MKVLTSKQANQMLHDNGRNLVTVKMLRKQKRLYPVIDHWYRHRYSVHQIKKYIEETKER